MPRGYYVANNLKRERCLMDAYSRMSEIDSLCDLPRMIRNKNKKRDVYNVCHVSRWLSRSCLWEHHKCQWPGHERNLYFVREHAHGPTRIQVDELQEHWWGVLPGVRCTRRQELVKQNPWFVLFFGRVKVLICVGFHPFIGLDLCRIPRQIQEIANPI